MAGLRAGAAGADVTPPVGLAHIGALSEELRDDLRASAVVFERDGERVGLVSIDTLSVDASLTAAIRERVAADAHLAPDHVMVLATHTHSSPVAFPVGTALPDEDYVRLLVRKSAGALVLAAKRLEPVRLSYGEGRIGFGVNRRRQTERGVRMEPNLAGPIDRRVRVLRVERLAAGADAPLAVLFSACCHPTSFPTSNATGGDYPAAARRVIERLYGGASTAVFLPGAFGDVRPMLLDGQGRFRAGTDVEVERMGRALGAAVVQAAEESSGIPNEPDRVGPTWDGSAGVVAARCQEAVLRYQSLPSREQLLTPGQGLDGLWKQRLLERLGRDGTLPTGEPCEVHLVRLGPFLLVAIAGEIFVEIGREIEQRLLAETDAAAVLVLGYANGSVGYLCTADAYAAGGFEAASAHRIGHRPAPFTPDTAAVLVDAASALARE